MKTATRRASSRSRTTTASRTPAGSRPASRRSTAGADIVQGRTVPQREAPSRSSGRVKHDADDGALRDVQRLLSASGVRARRRVRPRVAGERLGFRVEPARAGDGVRRGLRCSAGRSRAPDLRRRCPEAIVRHEVVSAAVARADLPRVGRRRDSRVCCARCPSSAGRSIRKRIVLGKSGTPDSASTSALLVVVPPAAAGGARGRDRVGRSRTSRAHEAPGFPARDGSDALPSILHST